MTSDQPLSLSVPHEPSDSIFCGIVERIKLNASVNDTAAAWHIAGSQNIRVERNGDLKIFCNVKIIIILYVPVLVITLPMCFHLTFLFFN